MTEDPSKPIFFSFQGKTKTLHISWIAFFLTFVVWFNHAPLLAAIRESMGLTDAEISILLILNVALTIPARIVVGMLTDRYGPRVVFSWLLFIASLLCFFFATAQDFNTLALARFLLGFVGAGFVIGIRLISEWYPAKQVGLAEGIYKGLGNFGSAAASLCLPLIALSFGGDSGWRYACGITGVLTLIYSLVFYLSARDTPVGATYFKPKKAGGLEVSNKADFFFYLVINIPLYAALAVTAWKLQGLGLFNANLVTGIYVFLIALYLYQCYGIYKVNANVFVKAVPEIQSYEFKQVAILNLAYAVTFGTELAVVSMLPLFFQDTWQLTPVTAGLFAACYALVDIISCPSGGWISDNFGRKKSLLILVFGVAVGFVCLSFIDSSWSLWLVVPLIMICSFFVGSGSGAVFAVVPLIKRRLTGQIAGVTGAYGNVGAVSFLTVLSFVSPQIFFLVIAVCAFLTLLALIFLQEPQGTMAEILPDGTVQLIEVS